MAFFYAREVIFMARATQPVSIECDDFIIEFDALMEESKTLETEVPQYPTEEGFVISDSIILQPITLSMTLYVTNTPVTWKGIHTPSPTRVQDVLSEIEELYYTKTPVTVTTSEESFFNMAITSIEFTKNLENGTSREIPISFQEIRVTQAQTTTIPESYGKSGKTGKNAGTAKTKSSGTGAGSGSGGGSGSEGSNPSDAYALAKGGGLTDTGIGRFIGGFLKG